MTTIFRLDSSIRSEGSVTRAIADVLEKEINANIPELEVIRREIGLTPLPSTVWSDSVVGGMVPGAVRSPDQSEAVALATRLADELADADAYIFAVPLYNFGVSQHAKAWVDVLLTEPRFNPKASQMLAGRPAFLVTARGGAYGPGTPRAGWDHSTAWLLRILVDVWGLNVRSIETELTLADVNPAMEALRPMATQMRQAAHEAALTHGSSLANALRAKAN
jgi:FMN-dependent NADH-azoreductase